MKKNYKSIKLFTLLLSLVMVNLSAQNCIQTTQYPSSTTITIGSTGSTNVTSCTYAGEYSVLNFTSAGSYDFSSTSTGGNYLTITDNLNSPIASGYSLLGVVIPSAGIYRCHISASPTCGTNTACHVVSVASSTFCSSTTKYPSSTNTISSVGITTITTCNYAGEYSVNNFSVAGIYTVNAVGGTANYITVKDLTGNVVYAQGSAPLVVNIPYTGIFSIHIASSNPATCGQESTCRVVTVQAPPPTGCSGNPQASNVVATLTTVCSGGNSALSLSNTYTATGIGYQWIVATNSVGPYVSIPNATLATYAASSLVTTAWFNCVVTCTNGPASTTATAIQVSVNPTPTAAITAPSVICSGQALNLVGTTNVGTNFAWTGPSNFTANVQNPTLANVQPNASGSYVLLVSTPNCTGTPVSVNVNVNSSPSALTLTPISSSICSGVSTSLSVNGGNFLNTLNIGTKANQNSLTNYPAPYSVYYGGQRMQVLVLASELSTAGFTANTPLTSISFPVVSKGSNWGTSTFNCQNFQVSVGTTTLTDLQAFQNSLTVVSTAATFTPSLGSGNTHNFVPSFVWNGTDNVIFETTFSNNMAGTTADGVVQYNSPTTFSSTVIYRADNTSASAIATSTVVDLVYLKRPDFKINGVGLTTYSWNPSSSLSSATGSSVVGTPSNTTIYTVSVANGNCITNNSATINVTQNPTVSIVGSSTLCLGGILNLTANGATTYTWNSGATTTSIASTPSVNTTYSVVGANGTCTNSAVQSVSVIALPTISIVSNSAVCSGSSLSLTANGATTYTWNSGATTTSILATPSVNTTYSVIGSNGTCNNYAVRSVTVNALPSVSLTATTGTACTTTGTIALNGSPSGGIYSGTGVTGSLFTTSTAGTFTPVYSFTNAATGCANTASSSIVVSICTGLSVNSSSFNGLNVYPNPNNGSFTIILNNGLLKTISIMDVTGRIVLSNTTSNDNIDFNISNLANGVYYVNIISNNTKEVVKIVKQ